MLYFLFSQGLFVKPPPLNETPGPSGPYLFKKKNKLDVEAPWLDRFISYFKAEATSRTTSRALFLSLPLYACAVELVSMLLARKWMHGQEQVSYACIDRRR
jgi:hypothetical protein